MFLLLSYPSANDRSGGISAGTPNAGSISCNGQTSSRNEWEKAEKDGYTRIAPGNVTPFPVNSDKDNRVYVAGVGRNEKKNANMLSYM